MSGAILLLLFAEFEQIYADWNLFHIKIKIVEKAYIKIVVACAIHN